MSVLYGCSKSAISVLEFVQLENRKITLMAPSLPERAVQIEILSNDCDGGEIFHQVYIGASNIEYTIGGLPTNAICRMKARGVGLDEDNITPLYSTSSFEVTFVASSVPQWGTIEAGQTRMGTDAVLLSWEEPDNGGSLIHTYKLYVDPGGTGNFELVYDGTGYPTVREYLITDLEPDLTYVFRIYAANSVGLSKHLQATYTSQPEAAIDPSYITGGPHSFPLQLTAGVPHTELRLQAVHPVTGLPEYLGGDCLLAQDFNCLPGRMFVTYLEPVCELDTAKSFCVPVTEAHPSWMYSTVPIEEEAPLWKRPIRAIDLSNGEYDLFVTGYSAGNYSLVIRAIWQYGLLGQYWDNSVYLGTPVESRVDSILDFNWEERPVARWSTDFVSARWTGFVEPPYNDTYTFYCEVADSNDNCRIWLDGVLIVERWFEDGDKLSDLSTETPLSSGRVDLFRKDGKRNNIPLVAGQLYSIRVDYRERTDKASIRLFWSSAYWQTKSVIYSRYLWRGAFIRDSPYSVAVNPGVPYGPESLVHSAEASDITKPFTSRLTTLYVQTRDIAGNDCDTFYPDTVVLASLTSDTSSSACRTSSLASLGHPMKSDDNKGGVYVIQLVLESCGQHTLSVTVNGLHVKSSPFTISIQGGPVAALQVVADGTASREFVVGQRSYIDLILRDAHGNPTSGDGFDPERDVHAKLVWLSPYDRLNEYISLPDPPEGASLCTGFTRNEWRSRCSGFEFLEDFLFLSNTFPVSIEPEVEYFNRDAGFVRLAFTAFRAGPSNWSVTINGTRIRGPYASPDVARLGPLESLEARENSPWYAWGKPAERAYGPMSIIRYTDLHYLRASPALANETNITILALLRDRFGNVISVHTGQDVTIRVGTSFGVADEPCSYSGGGQFFCSIIPVVANDSQELSVDIDGLPVSVVVGDPPIGDQCYGPRPCNTDKGRRITTSTGLDITCDCRQELIFGPHLIPVRPSSPRGYYTTIDCPYCFKYRGSLIAGGGPYEALVTLRDSAGNLITDADSYISENIPFESRVKVRAIIGEEWMEEGMINSNGTVTLMIKYTVAEIATLRVLVGVGCTTRSERNSRRVDSDVCEEIKGSPSEPLTFHPSTPSPLGSDCRIPANRILPPRVGEDFLVTCSPRDAYSNLVSDPAANGQHFLVTMEGPPTPFGIAARRISSWLRYDALAGVYTSARRNAGDLTDETLRPLSSGLWDIVSSGYDVCLTRRRSRVRSSPLVTQVVPGGSLVTIYTTPNQGSSGLLDAIYTTYDLDQEYRYTRIDNNVSLDVPVMSLVHDGAPISRWSVTWRFWLRPLPIEPLYGGIHEFKMDTTGGTNISFRVNGTLCSSLSSCNVTLDPLIHNVYRPFPCSVNYTHQEGHATLKLLHRYHSFDSSTGPPIITSWKEVNASELHYGLPVRHINSLAHSYMAPFPATVGAGLAASTESTLTDLGVLFAYSENSFTFVPRDVWGNAATSWYETTLIERLHSYISGDPDTTITWDLHPTVTGAYRATLRPKISSARMRTTDINDPDFLAKAKVSSFSSLLVVTLDGGDIKDSPAEILIGPSSGYGRGTIISGSGSYEATVALTASFDLTLFDRLNNPRLDWSKDDDVECWVSNTQSSHIVPIHCGFLNDTQTWRCTYTPIISGRLRIQCKVNGDFVRVGAVEYMTVVVKAHPVAPQGAAVHEIAKSDENAFQHIATRVNASFTVYSPDTGHVWPREYHKDQEPPPKLGLWYEDIYGNRVTNDEAVAMLCEADYPARLDEHGVGDTRSASSRKQIGPIDLDINLGRFDLPLQPEVFPSDGAWDSPWPEDMHHPTQRLFPSHVSETFYKAPTDWGFASLIWDGFLRPSEDAIYTLSLKSPPDATATRLFFNYTVDALNMTLPLKRSVHVYGIKGGESVSLLWTNGTVPLHEVDASFLLHSPSLLAGFPRSLNATTSPTARRLSPARPDEVPPSKIAKPMTSGIQQRRNLKKSSQLLLPAPERKKHTPTELEIAKEKILVSPSDTAHVYPTHRQLSDLPGKPTVVRGQNSENRITVKWDAVTSQTSPVTYTVLVDGEVEATGLAA
ncbi:hypothetical protein FOL47_008807 [Perkinsus chesapeaki]|uniref:Uncharacterized protein n=1 Tax=Perkinsus chesapeaki TaxID=330153 RepID=A0A7J6LC03_PERCH|nr:hypothetical protein FOL47_008807 [Perkinsus chesapeaki]